MMEFACDHFVTDPPTSQHVGLDFSQYLNMALAGIPLHSSHSICLAFDEFMPPGNRKRNYRRAHFVPASSSILWKAAFGTLLPDTHRRDISPLRSFVTGISG
jgi:hypothetical protein